MVTTTSDRLTPFLAAHEGFVSRAYRCPAGVITIGYGFTSRSKVFDSYWRTKTGHSLRMGDAITRAEADAVLTKMLAVEYAPPVARLFASRSAADAASSPLAQPTQHAFDGATSVSFNCGPGSLKWKWALALGRGEVTKAAALLKNTAVTANGRRLAGLVRRRKEEAALIQSGDYGKYSLPSRSLPDGRSSPLDGMTPPPSESFSKADVEQYQGWLKQLGLYTGDVDGTPGPLTRGAVENFQRKHGLVVDGKVGPATRAAMIRAVDAKAATTTTIAGSGTAGATGATAQLPTTDAGSGEQLPIPDAEAIGGLLVAGGKFAVVAAVLILVAFITWRNRGRFSGRRVPT